MVSILFTFMTISLYILYYAYILTWGVVTVHLDSFIRHISFVQYNAIMNVWEKIYALTGVNIYNYINLPIKQELLLMYSDLSTEDHVAKISKLSSCSLVRGRTTTICVALFNFLLRSSSKRAKFSFLRECLRFICLGVGLSFVLRRGITTPCFCSCFCFDLEQGTDAWQICIGNDCWNC